MSYIVPFQGVELFERTFRHQIDKTTGKVNNRKFVFDSKFGNGEGQLPVEENKYRLIWMPGCPHSNKAVITLRLLGLDRVISIGECGILRDSRGWVFSEDIGEVDPVLKIHYLDDAYLKGDPDFTGRSTVPAIIEIESGKVVQNEAWEIPKYLITDWKKYHKENAPDLYPEALANEIDETVEFIKNVNAYACGFARSQENYDEGYEKFFAALDVLDERLSIKRFLHGEKITLSDIHLYVALIRYHVNYHLIFGVNKKRLEDYENLWGYVRDLYSVDAFYQYTKLEKMKMHYQLSPHMRGKLGNVYGLMGTGPDNRELFVPSGREKLSSNPDIIFNYEEIKEKLYVHKTENDELQYIEKYVVQPIDNAGKATYQNELERWSHQFEDALKSINDRLAKKKYLLGDAFCKADVLLYQTLLRHDYIYYYLYKLNFAKARDFANIKRYLDELSNIKDISDTIDISNEKIEAYRNLDDLRNPYGLVFAGPQ